MLVPRSILMIVFSTFMQWQYVWHLSFIVEHAFVYSGLNSQRVGNHFGLGLLAKLAFVLENLALNMISECCFRGGLCRRGGRLMIG